MAVFLGNLSKSSQSHPTRARGGGVGIEGVELGVRGCGVWGSGGGEGSIGGRVEVGLKV